MAGLFRYVALGDSTGVGVGSGDDGGYPERLYRRLKGLGIPAGILNLARSGATTHDVLVGQVERAASKQPHLITLGIGTNDLWRLVPAETFAHQVTRIADVLEGSGAQVVVSSLIDLGHAPVAAMAERMLGVPRQLFDQRVRELNAVLEGLASRPRFSVMDLYGFSQRELPGHPELFCPDGFHPSSLGYDKWADVLWPRVEKIATAWVAERAATNQAAS